MGMMLRAATGATAGIARVIRAAGVASTSRDAEETRQEVVAREAAELLEQARAEAEEIRRQAHDEGWAAGLAAAQSAAQTRGDDEAHDAAARLEALVERIDHERAAWLRRWERNGIALAAAIAQRIVRREVREQPRIVLDLVREALELSVGSARVQLAMHADDLSECGHAVRQIVQQLGRVAEVEVVADESLERGECLVATDHGEIDQRFATQLARLVEELS